MSQSDSSRAQAEPVRVLSVPSGIPVCVRFLADVRGLDTHWKAGRTVPCPGSEDCPAALHRLGIIWRGYAPIEAWEASKCLWRPYVLEVTECLEERLRGRQLRGETWALHRTEDRGRSSAVVGVYCESVSPDQVRDAFDVEPVLRRVFHCGPLKLGTRNPVPAKVLLEALPGKPPTLPSELQAAGTPENTAAEKAAAAEVWKRFRQSRQFEELNGHRSGNGDGPKKG